jgi:small subunit ribosomal protein S11
MGKKRIITQTAEREDQKDTNSKATGKKTKQQVINGVAHIWVSYNNTIVSISDLKGNTIAWSSAGLIGFQGTQKSTPYAANLVAKNCAEKSRKFNLANIKIIVKGIGPGRESAMRGLAGSGLNVVSIMDMTPIAHNGVRRKKPRRV